MENSKGQKSNDFNNNQFVQAQTWTQKQYNNKNKKLDQ